VTTGGERSPVDGKPSFSTPVRGGRLVTSGSGSGGDLVVPGELVQRFRGVTAAPLLERHLEGLAFLETKGITIAATDPARWFDDLVAERAAEGEVLTNAGTGELVRTIFGTLFRSGGEGPIAEQPGIDDRLSRAPFSSLPSS
jgi:hypothetical protein